MTPSVPPAPVDHVVITLHGIRTFGKWQERLQALLETHSKTTLVLNYKYRYFSVVAFMVPFLRWIVTRRFRRALQKLLIPYAGVRVDVVAHSFGTHLVGWGLLGIPQPKRPKLHTVILAGSVLKPGFPWADLLADRHVERVINECGTTDSVLLLNQVFVLFTGMAGRIGFTGMMSSRFVNNWYAFGHSDYFKENGQFSEAFMAVRWVPALTSESLPPLVDERNEGASHGVLHFLLQNAEPIKVTLYAAPFALLALVYYTLYVRAEAATQIALARQLAALAELTRAEQPAFLERSVLLAVESMRRSPSLETDQALRAGLALLPQRVLRVAHLTDSTWNKFAIISGVDISRDERFLATASWDRTARIWDLAAGREIRRLQHRGSVHDVAFSHDGQQIATTDWDGPTTIWETRSGAALARFPAAEKVTKVYFSTDARQLLTFEQDGTVTIWDVQKRTQVRQFDSVVGLGRDGAHVAALRRGVLSFWNTWTGTLLGTAPAGGQVMDVSLNTTNRLVAAAGPGDSVRTWRLGRTRGPARLSHGSEVDSVLFSPDGTYLASSKAGGNLRIWLTSTGRMLCEVPYAGSPDAFSNDGMRFATTQGRVARFWDTVTCREVARVVHDDSVTDVAFASRSNLFALGSQDGTATVWRSGNSGAAVSMTDGESVDRIALDQDGTLLAGASSTGTIGIWNARTGERMRKIAMPGLRLWTTVGFQRDGGHLVVAGSDSSARLFDVATGRAIQETALNGLQREHLSPAVVSAEGTLLAGVGEDFDEFADEVEGAFPSDNTLRLWAVPSGRSIGEMTHSEKVTRVALSGDGNYVATASGYDTARVWRIADGREIYRVVSTRGVQTVALNRDGRYLATGGVDGTARVWSTDRRSIVAALDGDVEISALAFGGEERILAVGGEDGSVHIWDWGRREEVSRIVAPVSSRDRPRTIEVTMETAIKDLTFTANGRNLAVVDGSGTARIWSWQPEDLISQACSGILRNLTPEEWQRYLGSEPYRKSCPD